MTTDNHYIAGWNTPNDWAAFSAGLVVGGTEASWQEAYEKYYLPRLELRYLHPIKLLQENGTFQGEGFSIMAILCSLVEFLESTYQGKLYKYLPRGQVAGANEYSSSKKCSSVFCAIESHSNRCFLQLLPKSFIQAFVAAFYTKHQPKMVGVFGLNRRMEISLIRREKSFFGIISRTG